MFSPDYYDNLDPSYRDDLGKLEAKLGDPKSFPAQYALLDFIGKHMIPQKLWDLVSSRNVLIQGSYRHIIDNRTLHTFFYKDSGIFGKRFYDRDIFNGLSVHKELFPHQNLTKKMEAREKESYSFIPTNVRQRYEAMKELYLKIKDAEGDTEEWFDALVESDNLQFVRDNVEDKLGRDLTDRKLWKKYIGYLKEHDPKLLLETYSKYCRFFTDDAEMLEEYRQAAVKNNVPVSVPWKNPFDFEVNDSEARFEAFVKKLAERTAVQRVAISPPVKELLTIQFDASTAAKQKLPFKTDMLEYILDNANGNVLQKLFKTCKWFPASFPVNVCYKFERVDYTRDTPFEIKEQSILSTQDSVLPPNLDQIFISTVFRYYFADRNALSTMIPRIYRCTAKYFKIENQNLSLEDLQFLIGNAAELHLEKVQNLDENKFSLESILQLTPKIKNLRLLGIQSTAETSEKLCELKFQNKTDRIYLSGIKCSLLDPVKFAEFIKKNCSAKATITIHYYPELNDEEYSDRFRQVLGDAVNEKWPGDEKPYFSISS